MSHQSGNLNPVKKSNPIKSYQPSELSNVDPVRRHMLDSPSHKNSLYILNFIEKEKDIKQKKNANTFRRPLFSQTKKSPDRCKDNNQINIKLNFNSEIINNNYNQHIENHHNYNNNYNSNQNLNQNSSNKHKTYSESQGSNGCYDDLLKEKEKMISLLQKEIQLNQGVLCQLHKEKDEKPYSLSESEEIDNNNRKLLTTKSSLSLTTTGKFPHKLSSCTNVFSSPNLNNKNYASPRCFSSSLNFDPDSVNSTAVHLQNSNSLVNSLTLGKMKTMRVSEYHSTHGSTKNMGTLGSNPHKKKKSKQDNKLKTQNKDNLQSSTMNTLLTKESLYAQCEAIKSRAKRLLNEYNSILINKGENKA